MALKIELDFPHGYDKKVVKEAFESLINDIETKTDWSSMCLIHPNSTNFKLLDGNKIEQLGENKDAYSYSFFITPNLQIIKL